jgi:hypothetical protein
MMELTASSFATIPGYAGIPWFAWIPIVAIVCATVVKVVVRSHLHRERMAMIQAGMRPDDPQAPGLGKPTTAHGEV